MARNGSGMDAKAILDLVTQVEALPPEVLSLVVHRQLESQKEAKKGEKDQADQMSQFLNISKAMNPIQSPIPTPQGGVGQNAMLQQLLGTGMGDPNQSLLI